MMRRLVKRAVESGLRMTGLPRRRIAQRASGTVILSYHNIVPGGESPVGDRSLHLAQADFATQLDRLARTHDIVPLTSVVPGEVPAGRPRAVLTFDDAYRGALTAGIEELRLRNLPATIFVPPALLGAEGFWWDLLADPHGGLDPQVRDHVMEALGGRHDEALAWARAERRRPVSLPPHARPVEVAELEQVVAENPLLTLGSHSWSHVNLSAIPLAEAVAEMRRGHDWLRDEPWLRACPKQTADWLAYPYGRTTPEVEEAAGAIARGALRVEGGAAEVAGRWVAPPYRLPRVNIPMGLTPDGLVLRLAGLR